MAPGPGGCYALIFTLIRIILGRGRSEDDETENENDGDA